MPKPDPALELIYRRADYVIDDAGVNLTICLDGENPDLYALLSERNASTWAFLTAYNPNSLPALPEENAAAQAELIRDIRLHGHAFLHGYGTGDDWEPEASLFILDIDRELAINFGRKFGQSAILWGEIDRVPELVWCQ